MAERVSSKVELTVDLLDLLIEVHCHKVIWHYRFVDACFLLKNLLLNVAKQFR